MILKVDGMACEHCVKAVTAALEGLGLQGVAVDLKAGTVSFPDPAAAPLETIKAAITEAGYDVIS